MVRSCVSVLLGLLVFSSVPASADLIGDSVLIEQNRTSFGTLRDDVVTVQTGVVELSCPGPWELCGANIPGFSHGSFDIEALSFTLDVGTNVGSSSFVADTFNGYIFSGFDLAEGIDGVTLDTDIQGLDLSRIAFTDTSVAVNLESLSVDPGEFFTVPEPGRGAQWLASVLALGWLAHRRRA